MVGIESSFGVQPQNESSNYNIQQGDGNEATPAKVHELIVTKARPHPAYPHKHNDEKDDFGQKDRDVEKAVEQGVGGSVEAAEGKCPATEEERHHHRGRGN